MNKQILVAYATKYSATAEIAAYMGQYLRTKGFTVDVLPVTDVEDITPYTAVVLGSAVYAGQWRKEAAVFLELHEDALAERPTWFFSSGPTGEGDPVTLMKGWRFPEALEPFAKHIRPVDIAVFAGVLEMENLNLLEKAVVKVIKAPTGDFRDWTMIHQWADEIAIALLQELSEPA